MAEKLPISVLIPTLNEAGNIRDCIVSAAVADEIVLVDSGSTDGTCALAEELGARVVQFQWTGRLPKKKNWALENVAWKHEWIFILDADERFTSELAAELRGLVLRRKSEVDGYYVNRRFWFLDGWLRHCGYYPSWNLRFFKHRLGRYEMLSGVEDTGSGDNEVHEHVKMSGPVGHLKGELDHFAFPTIAIWIEKHNRYSNWEALLDESQTGSQEAASAQISVSLARKRRLKHLARRLPFRPSLRFVYHYVIRLGFLDGYRGFIFCRLMGFYEFMSVAKGAEIRARRSRP